MKCIECRFEDDVLMYVGTGRWPDRAPADLTAHAANCEVCRDLAAVASAMDAERDAEADSARVPTAGTVWWHAQLRARQEAVKAVGPGIHHRDIVAAALGSLEHELGFRNAEAISRLKRQIAESARGATSSAESR